MAPSLGKAAAIRDLHKLIDSASHQFFKGAAQQVRKAAIGGDDLSVKREREQHILEGVDQVAITALRTLHDLEELLNLGGGWRLSRQREGSHQGAQPGHFAPPGNGICAQQGHEENQGDGKSFQLPGERSKRPPGNQGQAQSQRCKQNKPKQPEPAFSSGHGIQGIDR